MISYLWGYKLVETNIIQIKHDHHDDGYQEMQKHSQDSGFGGQLNTF